ncbi:hypothetical protein [Agrobacterium larrymoorei]|uniref:SGNH/GDSL hydrolase family protein n=1 Tax=Agrobacterium larrymoorei TaxID=160699 RepID=A0ABX8T9Z6_9HYPH|nr:hypothetical protein [Agrobacterium larrymoorei]QYA10117.1 hypothetical protein J5285_23135 [Agrobacterium larrymoorei]
MSGFMQAGFFDAGGVMMSKGIDGIHLPRGANTKLGEALADAIKSLR